jgi:hypothetical protein
MAAVAVLPYSSSRFAALPSLGEASAAFAPRKAAALPSLVALIHAAGLADVAGVALLHAHFHLADEERLVQHAAVRAPRKVAPARSAGRALAPRALTRAPARAPGRGRPARSRRDGRARHVQL